MMVEDREFGLRMEDARNRCPVDIATAGPGTWRGGRFKLDCRHSRPLLSTIGGNTPLSQASSSQAFNALNLPGDRDLSDIAAAIREASLILPAESSAECRAVVVPAQRSGWTLFGGRLRILQHATCESSMIAAGAIRLLVQRVPLSELFIADGIQHALMAWVTQVGMPPGAIRLQTTTRVSRQPRADSDEGYPEWRCELYVHPVDGREPAQLEGPFFHAASQFFARSITEAASRWLDLPFSPSATSGHKWFALTLPDPRARIGRLGLEEDVLAVSIESGFAQGLYCAAALHDARGDTHTHVSEVTAQDVIFSLPSVPLRGIDVFLLDSSGFCFDSFQEDEHRCSRSMRLLYAPTPEQEVQALLRNALERGEGDQTEFKEWLPLDRLQAKSRELLRTTCAFANTRGGVLYIGVTDELEIRGLDGPLRKAARGDHRPTEALSIEYAQRLQRLLHEGIAPNVSARTSFVDLAGLFVLCVTVDPSPTRDHVVLEDNQMYIRRGANTAKARPSDFPFGAASPWPDHFR